MNTIKNSRIEKSFEVKDGIPRWLEFPVVLCALLIISPLLLLVAIVIKLTSQGSVLFKQQRVGRFGKNFVLCKFRTMRTENNNGPQVTKKNDNRITWIGGILRKTKLDELPELWNIVRGDMSIVGPRPEVPKYVDLENLLWKEVLQFRPGLTDPVTLLLRNEEELLAAAKNPEQYYLDTLQPKKLNGYLKYLRNRTWKSDLRVIKETIIAIIFPFETPSPKVDYKNSNTDIQSNQIFLFFKPIYGIIRSFIDQAVLAGAFILSYLLRFDFVIPQRLFREAFLQMLVVVLFQYFVIHISGVKKLVWRYISLGDFGLFVRAAILSAIPFLIFRIMNLEFLSELSVPFSIILMSNFFAFSGLIGIRICRRLLFERFEKRQISASNLSNERKNVLLIGAGRAGQMAAREIMGHADSKFEVAGFIDDDISKVGKLILGVKVYGVTNDLPKLSNEMQVENVILTISNAPGEELQRIVKICNDAKLNLSIMPSMQKLFDKSFFDKTNAELKVSEI